MHDNALLPLQVKHVVQGHTPVYPDEVSWSETVALLACLSRLGELVRNC